LQGALGDTTPGPASLLGAGGVGKAIAFALLGLGVRDLRLVDVDKSKATALAAALKAVEPGLLVTVSDDPADCIPGAEALLNCIPLATNFLQDANAAGLQTISGYELFFHQLVHAFRHFTGRDVDEMALRKALTDAA